MTQGKFLAKFNRFEFRVFFLLDQLPHQGRRTQSALLFTHNWRENYWIHTFPKRITAMWNRFELVSPCPFPTMITIRPRVSLIVIFSVYVWMSVLRFLYIYIYIYISSSSSSCRAASADILDPLSPFLPIIHRLRQVLRVTSCVLT